MAQSKTDEIYKQFLDCENVLWPKLRDTLAHAVDNDDTKLVKRIHRRMASIAQDVSYYTAARDDWDQAAS